MELSDLNQKLSLFIKEMEDSGIKYVCCSAAPINPDDAVAAAWDHDRKIATIELRDGSRVTYTSEAAHEVWLKSLYERDTVNERLQLHPDMEHPANFVAMYNYTKFGTLPGETTVSENGDNANEVSDPHAGMVQGYDGEWRWL